MVPFDHIAVMGIFGLNAADTLRLQKSLLKQWETMAGDFAHLSVVTPPDARAGETAAKIETRPSWPGCLYGPET
jgi:hypothetical protein